MKILVLGGGISGLSAAWYLRKKYPHAQITLLEKDDRLGGRIQTNHREAFSFEMGPRTFAVSRSSSLLQLIEEVGLKEEIIFSDPSASKRFLWHKSSLRSMGSFMPMLVRGVIREVFVPKRVGGDESIYDYAKRRLNRQIAETLFDPMVLGIYSGDIRKLSLRSCFPFLHEWEQKGCSILRGFIRSKKDGRLFTLKRGIHSLVDAMEKQMDVKIVLNSPVETIAQNGVFSRGVFWEADKIISALPGQVVGRMTKTWEDFPVNSVWVVNIGFNTDVLKQKGFGYLVPSNQQESVLGMVWDSAIFKKNETQTILTVMVRNRGDRAWVESVAVDALRNHLGCFERPIFLQAHLAKEAIPQFEVGYADRLAKFQTKLKFLFPSLILAGNYIDGVSVDACIRTGFKVISKI